MNENSYLDVNEMNEDEILWNDALDLQDQFEAETERIDSLTILELLEEILEETKNSDKLNNINNPSILLSTACSRLDLEPGEVVALAGVMEGVTRVSFDELASRFEVSAIRVLTLQSHLDTLIKKHYLVKNDDVRPCYSPRSIAVQCLCENRRYDGSEFRNLKDHQWFEAVDQLITNCARGRVDYDDLCYEVECYINGNRGYPFVEALCDTRLCLTEKILLLIVMTGIVKRNCPATGEGFYSDVIDYSSEYSYVLDKLKLGKGYLFEKNIFEHGIDQNGLADTESFTLTRSARQQFLGDLASAPRTINDIDLLSHHEIIEKHLFYNSQEQSEMKRLADLLQEKNFQGVVQRLKARGLRAGFTCLFYGAPGTGKTESCLQIARATGRDVLQIDMSTLRDKYVGESEKNVKEIFNRYRRLCKTRERAPILLLNEADAIISNRSVGNLSSVDKMENAMQNIILQELENFIDGGILIATTNLLKNFDEAFDRRFLYKIEFKSPDALVRSHIWQTILPDLRKSTAKTLATEFELSGGQIENIARKYAVSLALYDKTPSLAELRKLCKSEIPNGKKARPILGFGKSA